MKRALALVLILAGVAGADDKPASHAGGASGPAGDESGGAQLRTVAPVDGGRATGPRPGWNEEGTYRPSKAGLVGLAVKGALDKNVVHRYYHRNNQKFLYCYDRALKANPSLAGTVLTKVVIDANGMVKGAHAAGVSSEVAQCVQDVLQAIQFPKPKSGDVEVTVGIKYTSTDPPPKPVKRRGAIVPKH